MLPLLQQLLQSRVALLVTSVGLSGLVAGVFSRLIPGWLALWIVVATVAGLGAFVLVRQWWAARKERQFEAGLEGQASKDLGKQRVRDREARKELQVAWKEAVERLRRSKVGRRRRWLYFLPWYVIVGAPACGKSTAIANSGLKFPLGQPKLGGTGGTRNCDWWFSEDAIILDTAGRYTFNAENEPDREEWLEFLRLLRKYRPVAPVNGLILAVAADELLGKDVVDLEDDARNLRDKIDQLVEELGIHFPIYLLVTKCDLVEGFAEFFGRLPEKRRNEMLGWTNDSLEPRDPRELVGEAMGVIHDRVDALQPTYLHDESRPERLRGIFLFPQELDALEERLGLFAERVFGETRYAEAPFLRGIYLTSGLQKGSTISRMLERLGMLRGTTEQREDARSYFLFDFFQTRLPEDKSLVATSGQVRGWLRTVHNVGIAAAVAISVLVTVLAGGAYVANRTLLLRLEDAVTSAQETEGGGSTRIESLGDYVGALKRLEFQNRNRPWSARWGLWKGDEAIVPARALLLRRFGKEGFEPAIVPARRALEGGAGDAYAGLDAVLRNYKLSRILNHTDRKAPGENPTLTDFWAAGAEVPDELARAYQDSYLYFLTWRPETEAHGDETTDIELLRRRLPELLTVDGVAAWAARTHPAFTAADVSPAAATVAARASVAGGFRPEAWEEQVAPLVASITLLEGELEDADLLPRFREAYRARYREEWRDFATAAQPSAASRVPLGGLLGGETPYLAMLRATAGAAKLDLGGEPSAWMPVVSEIDGKQETYLATLAGLGKRLVAARQDPPAALEDLKAIFGRPAPLALGEGDPPPDAFGAALHLVRQLVNEPFRKDVASEDFRRVATEQLSAPIERAFAAYLEVGARAIDREWGRVRSGVSVDEACETLYARPSGRAWIFADEFLAGFVDRATYARRSRYGQRLPIDVSFLGRVGRRCGAGGGGAGGAPRTVFFEAKPTIDAPGAQEPVSWTRLEVYCDGEPWAIEHGQFRVEGALRNFSDRRCGPATLTVYGGQVRREKLASLESRTLLGLIRRAKRQGDTYEWILEDGSRPVFVIRNLPTELSPDLVPQSLF